MISSDIINGGSSAAAAGAAVYHMHTRVAPEKTLAVSKPLIRTIFPTKKAPPVISICVSPVIVVFKPESDSIHLPGETASAESRLSPLPPAAQAVFKPETCMTPGGGGGGALFPDTGSSV